jgi:hypothetical protein
MGERIVVRRVQPHSLKELYCFLLESFRDPNPEIDERFFDAATDSLPRVERVHWILKHDLNASTCEALGFRT